MAKYGQFIQTMMCVDVLDWVQEATPVLIKQIREVDEKVGLNLDTLKLTVHCGVGATYGWTCESRLKEEISW